MRPLKRGDTYKLSEAPTELCPYDPKATHTIEVVSDDGVRLNIVGQPLRSVLVRCQQCQFSWTFGEAATDA